MNTCRIFTSSLFKLAENSFIRYEHYFCLSLFLELVVYSTRTHTFPDYGVCAIGYKAEGHRIGNMKDVSVYYNFAERRAYYVVNGKAEDKFIEF